MAAIALAAAPVTYIFGDSLTDVGNNNFLQYSLAKSNYPWYGIDYSGGQATGRFCNGRTIGDFISAKLGIPSPPAYLSVTQNVDTLLKGVNYASGGAGILNDTGLYFIQRLSFDDQINNFKKTKEVITANIREVAANKHFNEATYFIGIGSNDYVNNFLQPFLPDGQQYTHEEFIELLISTLDQQLQRVKSKRGQCLKRINEWILQFNSNVQKLINRLNLRLPNAKFIFADTYPLVLDLINNPSTYGFKDSNTSCCNVDTSIGGLCLPNSKVCKNRHEFVFWDAFHPSDAANAVLAEKFFSLLFTSVKSAAPTPSPTP
ncbi:hypothetical protein LR48_Vigan07g076000 [Vigna angularis]|uniref:SGNH hydrolase-type esterase domain-containing protein n=1 Tax=Phaseolus angularis TaxID=3914 RepID=A0A0L9UWF7_PHAAN|nr:hypothetical protein LR48_Vigan07g076000 [Vigna angularis]